MNVAAVSWRADVMVMVDGSYINWVEDAERARAIADQYQSRLPMPEPYRRPRRSKGSADLMRVDLVNDCGADPWVTDLFGDVDDSAQWLPVRADNPWSQKVLNPALRVIGQPYTSDGLIWGAA